VNNFRPVKPREFGTTKEVVGRAVDEAGGAKRVRDLLGVSLSAVYGFADPETQNCDLSYDRARRLTEFGGVTVLAQDLAELAGGLFLPQSPVDGGRDWAELGDNTARESGELIGGLIRALSDGKIRESERDALLKDAHDLGALVCCLIAKLKATAP
jgi:hypothetical protein